MNNTQFNLIMARKAVNCPPPTGIYHIPALGRVKAIERVGDRIRWQLIDFTHVRMTTCKPLSAARRVA
jgi:hypothetical protein